MTPAVALDSYRPIPGISNLHPYILWSIFNLNADIHDESPLETARHTSQVCRSWRKIILSSPALWGKMLKKTELQVNKNDSPWRDLVMERTKTAPLFFKGKVPWTRFKWVLDFVSTYWTRTCQMDIHPVGDVDEVDRIRAWVATNTGFLDGPSERITSLHLPHARFNLQAPWVSNLRSLTLDVPFTTTQILQCIANTPYLEDVRLFAWYPDFLPNPKAPPVGPQQISLPHLSHIYIKGYYSLAGDILRRINPKLGCSYAIYTAQDGFATNEAQEIFSGYFRRQIHLPTEHKLRVSVSAKSITVILDDHYLHEQQYRFSEIKKSFLIYYISEVDLDIHDIGDKEVKSLFDSIVYFLFNFSSVTSLKLSKRSLILFTEYYLRGQIVNEKLFPSLTTLVFGHTQDLVLPTHAVLDDHPCGLPVDLGFPIRAVLVTFLTQRRSYSRPIRKLIFGPAIPKLELDWSLLEEFDGMEVWFDTRLRDGKSMVCKYICGSGRPEELDMTEDWEDRFNMKCD